MNDWWEFWEYYIKMWSEAKILTIIIIILTVVIAWLFHIVFKNKKIQEQVGNQYAEIQNGGAHRRQICELSNNASSNNVAKHTAYYPFNIFCFHFLKSIISRIKRWCNQKRIIPSCI